MIVTPIDNGTAESPETVVLTLSSNASLHRRLTQQRHRDDCRQRRGLRQQSQLDRLGNGTSGNSYGWSNTSNAGGSTGEIGGKFARNTAESYYADTNLTQRST